MQTHIKEMTELFEALALVRDAASDEDRVVYLLASLPESFNMLVTALEASSENVPKMEIVTERLLHEERKLKEKGAEDDHSGRKALIPSQAEKGKPFSLQEFFSLWEPKETAAGVPLWQEAQAFQMQLPEACGISTSRK